MSNGLKVLLGPSQMGTPAVDKLKHQGFEVIDNPYKRKLTKDELKGLLPGVDGIVAGLEPLDRDILKASALKVISRCGSGVTNVDQDAAHEYNIAFYFTPFGPTASVAELTLCNILALMRNLPRVNASMHNRVWQKNTGHLLSEKTVVVIGFGKIGQAVARLLQPFHVNLIAVDPYFEKSGFDCPVEMMAIDAALPKADVILLHSSSEECILGNDEFNRMKTGVYVLNASRGALIDEEALIGALASGRVAGAWLDVFKDEPYSGLLCEHENVILTPHIASYTKEGRLKMEDQAVENLIQGFKEKGLI